MFNDQPSGRRPVDPATLRELIDKMIGQPVRDARSAVHSAGGIFIDLSASQPMSADIRRDRVLVRTSGGRVIEAELA